MSVERNQSNTSLPKSSTSNESTFPSDKELASFQKQSKKLCSIKQKVFARTLKRI